MGDVVNFPIPLDGDLGRDFITDCARYCEGLLDENAVKLKYHFDDSGWENLADNAPLRQAVEKERAQRIHDGSAARERAQQLFAQTPDVLGGILHGDGVSPRHKIESAKELRAIAANGPAVAPTTDRFQITIILNSDVLHFDKSITPDPNDIDPFNDIDTTPQGLLPVIAANKSKGGNDGEPI